MNLRISLALTLALVTPTAVADESCHKCDVQMRKVFEATQAWRRANGGHYPPTLSALVSSGLLSKGSEVCPEVRHESPLSDFRTAEETSSGVDADRFGAYEYELSLKPKQLPMGFLDPGDAHTRRDAKAPLLRRKFYEQVPILRCPSHRAAAPEDKTTGGPRRNLTATGDIYWSGSHWEYEWLDDVPYCAREIQPILGLKGPLFHSGRPLTLDTAIDLRPWACAFGDHPWWWTLRYFDHGASRQTTPSLRAFFKEDHGRVEAINGTDYWIDGLVQLQGKLQGGDYDYEGAEAFRFPSWQVFSWEKGDLPVDRKIRSASWLQATTWESPFGEIAGTLIWHYQNRPPIAVDIVIGKHTARFWASERHLAAEAAIASYAQPAWQVTQPATIGAGTSRTARQLRLYEQVWKNPHPAELITALTFKSNRDCTASPLIVAISVEPTQ